MIFLTGSTGFLGREILRRLLSVHPQKRFRLLVRGDSRQGAERRMRGALIDCLGEEDFASQSSRIEIVWGDLSEERFGSTADEFRGLASGVTDIFHCAATTCLELPLKTARAINVGGTKHTLDLAAIAARLNPFSRFHHISTAFVAGSTQRVVTADELRFDEGFRNSYEQSKAEAEALVREAQTRLQATIFRPSVIVGDSTTGKTSAFNVVYLPARLLIKGVCKAMPALPNTPFDVVPVDYVADAIVHLSQNPDAVGECYHLSAGVGRESTPLEVLESFMATVDKHRKRRPKHLGAPLFVAPELIAKAFCSFSAAAHSMRQLEKKVTEHLSVFRQILPLVPYMLSNPRFDTTKTLRDLSTVMDPPPLFKQYAETVFRYCLDTNWGRRPLPSLK